MTITAEQLAQRRNHIGSSDMAAILGVDQRRNAADVYWSKVQDTADGLGNNEAITLGNAIELPLLNLAAERLGVEFEPNVHRVHTDGILAANLDALIIGQPAALEAKTSGLTNPMWDDSDWGREGTDEVPDRVIIQAQHQMLCADLEVVHVPALLGRGRGFQLFRITRSEELTQVILEAAHAFWNDHVLKGIPPAGTPSLETLKRIPRRQEADPVEIDADLFGRYLAARAAAKAAEDEKKQLELELIASLGTAEIGQCALGTFRYPEQSRSALDQKALKAAHPELAEQFTQASSFRRVFVKEAR